MDRIQREVGMRRKYLETEYVYEDTGEIVIGERRRRIKEREEGLITKTISKTISSKVVHEVEYITTKVCLRVMKERNQKLEF